MRPSIQILVIALAVGFTGVLHAAKIKVPKDQASINGAIAVAAPGDVIEVSKGTYLENVVVDVAGITIVGKGKVTIDAQNVGTGIRVAFVDGVTLKNLRVRNTGLDGIFLDAASNCRVQKCRVDTAQLNCIHIGGGTGNDVCKCSVTNATIAGIAVTGAQNLVRNNKVDTADDCVRVDGGANVIEANTLDNSVGQSLNVVGGAG